MLTSAGVRDVIKTLNDLQQRLGLVQTESRRLLRWMDGWPAFPHSPRASQHRSPQTTLWLSSHRWDTPRSYNQSCGYGPTARTTWLHRSSLPPQVTLRNGSWTRRSRWNHPRIYRCIGLARAALDFDCWIQTNQYFCTCGFSSTLRLHGRKPRPPTAQLRHGHERWRICLFEARNRNRIRYLSLFLTVSSTSWTGACSSDS